MLKRGNDFQLERELREPALASAHAPSSGSRYTSVERNESVGKGGVFFSFFLFWLPLSILGGGLAGNLGKVPGFSAKHA